MRGQVRYLKGLQFGFNATNALIVPYLSLFFAHKGYSTLQIGVLLTIGPFASIFAYPFWGFISDRMRTVKKVILLLWIMTIAASVALFFAEGFTSSLVFTLMLNFFMYPSAPLLDSITIQSAQQAGRSYGSIRMWGSAGFTFISLIAGYAIALFGGIDNMLILYWTIWILPLLLLMFIKEGKQAGEQRSTLQSIRSVALNSRFLWFLLLVFIVAVPHRMNDTLFGIYLSDMGATDMMVGWAWAISGAAELITFAVFSRYMHLYHELALLTVVSVLYAVRWFLYSMTDDPWVLMTLQVTHMVTYAVLWLAVIQYMVRIVPTHLCSTGQSLLAVVFAGLAGISGGTLGGWVSDRWGGAAMYQGGVVLSLLAGLLFFITHVRERRSVL